ncbi:MAG TPA: EAL domain-containing protein [Candidatus Baltobacteraceae bacterium]|nr:EAL domain-containing protein [Candidatus Baltobacteraceae bacterium]
MSYRLVPMHQRLANALSYGEFRIFYQPVVTVKDGEIIGVEALCRWPQRDQTFAMPETFIAHAETSGFIIQLGDWVLRTAAEQVRRWQQLFKKQLRLAVNLSGRQFLHFNLIKGVEDALRNANFNPADLDFEITETIAMHNAEESVGVMRQLKSLGIGLSLDDFGTGYSSLSYLKRFPIDVLKIDKSFVRDIPADANDLAIVSAIIAMAHALGLKVIAEGVETEAQWHFLRDCGTQMAQGYYFGRPLPASELEELLARRAPLIPVPAQEAQGISGTPA